MPKITAEDLEILAKAKKAEAVTKLAKSGRTVDPKLAVKLPLNNNRRNTN